MSDRIRAEIANHGYSNPLEVLEHGLIALSSGNSEQDDLPEWMMQEIAEACDELDRDPTLVMTMEESGEALRAEYARALKAG